MADAHTVAAPEDSVPPLHAGNIDASAAAFYMPSRVHTAQTRAVRPKADERGDYDEQSRKRQEMRPSRRNRVGRCCGHCIRISCAPVKMNPKRLRAGICRLRADNDCGSTCNVRVKASRAMRSRSIRPPTQTQFGSWRVRWRSRCPSCTSRVSYSSMSLARGRELLHRHFMIRLRRCKIVMWSADHQTDETVRLVACGNLERGQWVVCINSF